MLIFQSKTQREQYAVSSHEYNMAHTGYLYAYERNTSTFWKPIGTGRGPSKWKQISGPLLPRAFGGDDTTLTSERLTGDLTVPAGDTYVVVDSIDVETSAQVTLDGEMEFRKLDRPGVVRQSEEFVDGQLTLDGQKTVDGQLTFRPAIEYRDFGFLRQLSPVGMGQSLTIPVGYQLQFIGVLQLDGELHAEGELV